MSQRVPPPFGGSKTIEQFCSTNGISRSFYYKLKHAGLGPDEMRFGKAVRISSSAEAEWHRRGERGNGLNPDVAAAERMAEHAALDKATV
jgi:hypothetical protein